MAEDSKVRCRCKGEHGCACTKAGKPVAVPPVLAAGRLPGVTVPLTASTRARRPVNAAGPVRRTPAQKARALAAKEQFFRSSSPSERRRAGLPPHPERPGPVMVSAAVPWRFSGALVASARPQRFYLTDDRKDQARRAFHDAAMTIVHAEAANLAGESVTDTQLALCGAYADLMVAGKVVDAVTIMDALRRSAGDLRRARVRSAMGDLEVRLRGRTGALVAREQRGRKARMDHLAVQILGPERAAATKEMRRLRQRVDRLRLPGGGSAA